MNSRRLLLPLAALILGVPPGARADDPQAIVEKAIAAAGGRDKLLTLFRIEERYHSGAEPLPPEKASKRVSVIEPPKYWWLGGRDRAGEPAKFDVWAWTLGVLVDPKTVIEPLAGVEEGGKTTVALRASATVTPAMELHFDPGTHRLVRLDWRGDTYRFSDWRVHDGAGYQAKTLIFKKGAEKPWFHHEITALERLSALPEGLKRDGE